MKRRILTILWATALGSMLASGRAQVRPSLPPLPDYDVRQAAPPASIALHGVGGARQAPALSAAQLQALKVLEQRIPGITVSRDNIVGSPRSITAPSGFLTGVGGRGRALSADAVSAFPKEDHHRVIKAFINEHADLFGHTAQALDAATLKRDYVSTHNGMRTVVWEQAYQGVPVFAAVMQGNISEREELVRLSSQFVPNLDLAAVRGAPNWSDLVNQPTVSAKLALAKASADLGAPISEDDVRPQSLADGVLQKQRLRSPQTKGDSYVQLTWLPMDRDTMRLCWQVILVNKARGEGFRSLVDAQTGEVLVRHNLTRYQATQTPVPANYRVFTSDSPSPFSPGWPTPNAGQPPVVPRTLLTNFVAYSIVASPNGWLNPVNLNGAYETVGNNVDAHTDVDDDDIPDLPRPQSMDTPPVFDFPLDLSMPPLYSTNASVVNLFHLNNFMHDKLYQLGFTEAAGNFQTLNFNRGGQEGDAVEADALDGAALNDFYHRNNANFLPLPDGIPGRMQMYVFDGPMPDRDGSLDAEVVCHEYTHGLSDRLVGGGVGIYALQTAGMGEGWSDFYPLCLLSEASDDPNACYAVGGYATYNFYGLIENYYYGIRRYPYSTDMTKNPLTLKDIDPTVADPHNGVPLSPVFVFSPQDAPEVHNQGEVWCIALWEVRANLVDTLGWDEGNQAALQLVTDAMKLCPPNPTFLESRDAILLADELNSGGANRGEIWRGFAKRGYGQSAKVPASSTTVGVVEAFDVPADVVVSPPDGILEILITPANDATVLGGANTSVFVRVRDGVAVTNATVRGLINNATQLTFNNSGTPPDSRARDSIYSGQFTVPSTGSNLTLTVTVTAPGKISATNTLSYFIAIRPPNDLFSRATKVPAEGGVFASNNKYASEQLETGEPAHGGASSVTSSVWWTWKPTASARTLIDTGGSRFNTLLGVYTGTGVANLTEVGSASTVGQQRKGYVIFDAKAQTVYQIAVASLNTNNAGQINLSILPGGQPDLTPPTVQVAKPVSGMIISSNTIPVIAEAVDPGPVASGVDRINFRVSPRNIQPSFAMTGGAVGSTNLLALTEGVNTITVTATDVVGNTSDPIDITVTYRRLSVPNDHFNFATLLPGVSGVVHGSTAEATKQPGEPQHAGVQGGHSVWWKWIAPEDGALLLSTEGSDFDTVMGLYVGERVDRLQTIGSNDDAFDGSQFSKLQQGVRANETYYVGVDGFNGTTGLVQLAYAFTPGKIYTINLQSTAGGSILEHGVGDFDVPADSAQILTAVPDNGYEFSGWEGDFVTIANPLSFVAKSPLTIKATFRLKQYTDDFETGNLTRVGWVTDGAAPWTVVAGGVPPGQYAARSGAIGNNQQSSLRLTGNFLAGDVTFNVRVSSEAGWDYLGFYVDGVRRQQWSGELAWDRVGFPISAGIHTLEWRYVKDAQTSVGQDGAFIDNVLAPLRPAVDNSSKATLSIQLLPQGQYELWVKGQSNQVYVIEQATGFQTSGRLQWSPYSTNVANYGEIRLILSPGASSAPWTFYRAVAR